MLEETLDTPTPVDGHPDRLRIMAMKKDAAISGVTARLKADENAFRRRNSDALAELYEQVTKGLGRRPGSLIDVTPVA